MSGHPVDRSQGHLQQRRLITPVQKFALTMWFLPALFGTPAHANDLKPETVAAFNHYVAATEAQMENASRIGQFLIVDRLPDQQRQSAYDQLRQGQSYIEELHTEDRHHPMTVPNGLIHHWAGVIFIRKGTLAETVAVLQDYDNHERIYKPQVRQAKLVERKGNESKVFEQFYSKSIVTVVLDVYLDVVETQMGSTRTQSVSHSTRIAEVMDIGSPSERERTDGKDHGYMWRLNSYWRMEEKDGGVYVQTESITLSRTVPFMLSWIINPLTKTIPRDVIVQLLADTRNAVLMPGTASKQESLPARGRQ
jgi:hypothetical protein